VKKGIQSATGMCRRAPTSVLDEAQVQASGLGKLFLRHAGTHARPVDVGGDIVQGLPGRARTTSSVGTVSARLV
jgi:hypothetical protein